MPREEGCSAGAIFRQQPKSLKRRDRGRQPEGATGRRAYGYAESCAAVHEASRSGRWPKAPSLMRFNRVCSFVRVIPRIVGDAVQPEIRLLRRLAGHVPYRMAPVLSRGHQAQSCRLDIGSMSRDYRSCTKMDHRWVTVYSRSRSGRGRRRWRCRATTPLSHILELYSRPGRSLSLAVARPIPSRRRTSAAQGEGALLRAGPGQKCERHPRWKACGPDD